MSVTAWDTTVGEADVGQGKWRNWGPQTAAPDTHLGELHYPLNKTLENLTLYDENVSEQILAAITDGTLIETMDGAWTLELNVNDPKRELRKSGLLQDWMLVNQNVYAWRNPQRRRITVPPSYSEVYGQLDGRDFSLANLTKSANAYSLTMESRAVNKLRQITNPRTWFRDVFTRAMAIGDTLKEVTDYHIAYYCPELHKIQPIQSTTQKLTAAQVTTLKQKGFSPNPNVTVKGQKATPTQLNIIERVLRTGISMGANYNVLVSAIMCITQESDIGFDNSVYGYGPFDQLRNGAWPASVTDVEADATAYFKIAIARQRANSGERLADLVQFVQRSGAGPEYYNQWEREARATVTAFGGGSGLPMSGGVSSTVLTAQEYNRYAFRRGGDNGQKEDSWTFDKRLADEVDWYLFMVNNTLYYVEPNELYTSAALDVLTEDDDGIDTIDCDLDTNRDFQSVTVHCYAERWTIPPGAMVEVQDHEAEGKWLVQQVQYPLFNRQCEATLILPGQVKPEPAPTTTSTTTQSGGSGLSAGGAATVGNIVAAVYNKAVQISGQGLPYTWGGGHNSTFSPGPGYDCSGYTSACLHAGGILGSSMTSGEFETWGQPGPGKYMTIWCNSGHVFIEFKLPGVGHVQANTSPGPGPKVIPWGSNGASDAASGSFVERHWPGT